MKELFVGCQCSCEKLPLVSDSAAHLSGLSYYATPPSRERCLFIVWCCPIQGPNAWVNASISTSIRLNIVLYSINITSASITPLYLGVSQNCDGSCPGEGFFPGYRTLTLLVWSHLNILTLRYSQVYQIHHYVGFRDPRSRQSFDSHFALRDTCDF